MSHCTLVLTSRVAKLKFITSRLLLSHLVKYMYILESFCSELVFSFNLLLICLSDLTWEVGSTFVGAGVLHGGGILAHGSGVIQAVGLTTPGSL